MQGNDLVQRLRDRAYSGLPDPLSEQAADEIARLRLAVCRLADQDATLAACEGNVTVDCSTEIKFELTDERRAALMSAIENDRKRGVMLVPGPQTFTLTDAEREAIERAIGFCECTASPLPTSNQIATLRGLLERLGGGR